MNRIRKAWRIAVRGIDEATIVYAPTASKARSWLYREMDWDWTFKQFLAGITVARCPSSDIALPARHPLAPQLSDRVLHCVVHAYGGTGLRAGYRDHFYTSDRDAMPKAAHYHGLFEMHRVPRSYAGSSDMVSYILTDLGKNVARGEAETYPAF
jgi:hypothetical protein